MLVTPRAAKGLLIHKVPHSVAHHRARFEEVVRLPENLLRLDAMLAQAAQLAKPLPSLAPDNAASERMRLVACLQKGEMPVPVPVLGRRRLPPDAYRAIDEARALAGHADFEPELGRLYLDRLEELELELAILDAWGDPARIRPICARRYGRGDEPVVTSEGRTSLAAVAHGLLSTLPNSERDPDAVMLPAAADQGEPSVAAAITRAALGVGLDVEVRVEPRLASLAATGERTVFLAARAFTQREARRLVAHEVFGHLVVAANARAQPLRLLSVGLAGSFADQEGLAIFLEEQLGVLCSDRMRTLAARVAATQWLYAGASFGETAQKLHTEHRFSAEASIAIAERTYRGGGVARDAGYLAGYLRVQRAVSSAQVEVDELRLGRVSVASIPVLRTMLAAGWLRPACYRPSFSLSRRLTLAGTSADTSPPSDAASLTMLELT